MQRRVLRFTDSETLSREAAHAVSAAVRRAVAQRGISSLVLSGGSSPRRLYDLLGGPEFSHQIDWEKVHVFWSDERCVGPDDARSNYYLARTCLLEHVPLPPAHIHRMYGEIDPHEAARKSAADIRSFFGERVCVPGHVPSFDCVLLGMGADGHVASLFPGDEGVLLEEELVIATRAPEGMPVAQRLSMSLPLLASARDIFFVVFGRDKQPVLDLVLADSPAAQHYPAARVCARSRTVWFVAP
jgi:6-phosphogluconolactonase